MTPPGVAAIAVIRVSGARVPDFLQRHLSKPVSPGRCVHSNLLDEGRVIDDAIVVWSQEQSFADISVHGSPWIVRSVLELARHEGFEVMESSELPLAAQSVDAESELQHEVLSHLPLARTELGVRVLLSQESAWRRLKQHNGESLEAELRRMLEDRTLEHLLHPPVVAIVGAPNVGKSTIANQLFAQERSITADLPGTTRDWVGEIANLAGLPVMLLDTPGLRQTDDPLERAAIERSGGQIAGAELVVLVLDGSRPLEPDQSLLLARFENALQVINKCDRPCAWDRSSAPSVHTIATTGSGISELRRQIVSRFCAAETLAIDRAYCWTERQRKLISDALASRNYDQMKRTIS